jgi:polyisoprenyl-teichoic acid--peptidoglycan teichoic acid transferase
MHHPSRRSLIASLLAVPFVAAGCSDNEKPKAQPSTSTTTTTTTPPPPKPKVVGKGLPADLLATMTALYLGGSVATSSDQRAALAKRKTAKASLTVAGSTGTWKGFPIAVVTRGKDVTLLVKPATKKWTVVGGWWPSLGVARVPRKSARVLAIGSDARNHQRPEKCRADALQLIGVDNKGVGGIVGIPRDSYVPLSTGGTNKVNAALAFGGPAAQVRTVARATGVPIDGYVMAGFKGFRAMVTAVGGITFASKTTLRSVDGYQILRAGTNKLNSKTALGLARERKHLSNGDFGRSANQGRLIRAGMVMARAQGPARLPRYLTAMSPHLTTDLDVVQVLNLAATVYLGNPAATKTAVASGSVGTRGGQSVVLLGGSARAAFANIKDGRLG